MNGLDTARIGWHAARARWRWMRLNQSNLADYHDRRMRQITTYAWQHAPFYRRHWQGHDIADWRTLPIIDKSAMMSNFSQFNTHGIERDHALTVALRAEQQRDFSPTIDGLTVGLSSGTSGHRGLFLVAPHEQRAWAGTILARMLQRLPTRIAFFLRSNSNLYQQIGGRLVRFRYFDLMLPPEQAIADLNALQPDVLVAPPSLLLLLARELDDRLHIAPQQVISVAEVLEPQDQTELQQRFGVPIQQIYQCTEGLIALGCAHGSLHIQEDVVAVQGEPFADDPQRIVPVVSDLWRTTQPIVRYRLNDVLRLSNATCACGSAFRVIAGIEGRCDDLFTFPSAAGGTRTIFPDVVRRMVLLGSDAVREYQAIQDRSGHMELRLELDSAADWTAEAALITRSVHHTLARYACHIDDLTLLPRLLPIVPGAKRRRVWRRTNDHATN